MAIGRKLKNFTTAFLIAGTNMIFTGCQKNLISPVGAGPSLSTDTATYVTNTSAIISAKVNPHGTAITCYFEYGPTTAYGFYLQSRDLPGIDSVLTIVDTLKNLSAQTQFHYRAVGVYEGTIIKAEDRSFTTLGQRDYFPPLSLGQTLRFNYYFFQNNRNVPHDPEYEIQATATWTVTQVQQTPSLTTRTVKQSKTGIRINWQYYRPHDTTSWNEETTFSITEDSTHSINIPSFPFWIPPAPPISRFLDINQPDSLVLHYNLYTAVNIYVALKVNEGLQACSNSSWAMSNSYQSSLVLISPP